MTALPASVDETARLLAAHGYIADRELATTVHLSLAMNRPLFLEGEPGTGITETAHVAAARLNRRFVRPPFLHVREKPVDQDHDEDGYAELWHPGDHGQCTGEPEHHCKEMEQLRAELLPW